MGLLNENVTPVIPAGPSTSCVPVTSGGSVSGFGVGMGTWVVIVRVAVLGVPTWAPPPGLARFSPTVFVPAAWLPDTIGIENVAVIWLGRNVSVPCTEV